MQRLPFWVAAMVASSGCVHGPQVPPESRGTIPLVVSNHHDNAICTLRMYPVGAVSNAENWLGGGYKAEEIAPGHDRTFQIKTGTYEVRIIGCNGAWGADTRRALVVRGPTYLGVGAGQGDRPAGYIATRLSPHPIQQYTPGTDTGTEGAAEEPGGESTGSTEAPTSTSTDSGSPPPSHTETTCKGPGSVVNMSPECCSNKTKLVRNNTTRVCCDSGADCT